MPDRQRKAFHARGPFTALTALGMIWHVDDRARSGMLALCRDYHATHDHLNIPTGGVYKGRELKLAVLYPEGDGLSIEDPVFEVAVVLVGSGGLVVVMPCATASA